MKQVSCQFWYLKAYKLDIHIDVEFRDTILILCRVKMPSKYLLFYFLLINYLSYALFKILMILCDDLILLVLVRYRYLVVFSVGANFLCPGI